MKFSKTIKIIIFISYLALNRFGQNLSKVEADQGWQMLETGKTEDSFWYLVYLREAIFR